MSSQACRGEATRMKRKFIVLYELWGLDDDVDVTEIFPGELFEIRVDSIQMGDEWPSLSLRSIDRQATTLECGQRDVRELGSYEAHLLQPVTSYQVRLELLQKNCLEKAGLEHGSSVTVQIGGKPFPGLIRYSGPIHGRGDGIYFGVELPHHCGHGYTDGSVNGRYYFRCSSNSGIFVNIQQLRALEIHGEDRSGLDNVDEVSVSDALSRKMMVEKSGNSSNQSINHLKAEVVRRQDSFQLPTRDRPMAPGDLRAQYPVFQTNETPSRSNFVNTVDKELGERVGALAYGMAAIDSQMVQDFRQRLPALSEQYTPMAAAASVSELEHLPLRLELEEPIGSGAGVLNGEQLFVTRPNHAVYAPLVNVADYDVHSHWEAPEQSNGVDRNPVTSPMVYRNETAGPLGARRMQAAIDPVVVGLQSIHPETEFGKMRGIQGHQNSCYLDSTLFAMFAFSNVFDKIVFRKRRKGDIHGLEEVQAVLNELIVKPLRNKLYVRGEEIMKLQELIDQYIGVNILTNQNRDPKDFLSVLLEQIFKNDPLLKLTSGDVNWYTLSVENNFNTLISIMQDLFDASLIRSDVRLKETPKCLILHTPRSGTQSKKCRQILPSPTIDITDAIVGQARSCCICQETAQLECKDCYGWIKDDVVSNLSSMAFCRTCFSQRHKKSALTNHKPIELAISPRSDPANKRVMMELFAVICRKTSYYVAFAKNSDGMWYFVDSMADRVGGEGSAGYSQPQARPCPEMQEFLNPQEGLKRLIERLDAGSLLSEPVNRFFEDAYLYMYQPKPKTAGPPLPNAADISKEHKRLLEERSCTICMELDRQITFEPCGHMVCCVNCAGDILACPICRGVIAQKKRVYLS